MENIKPIKNPLEKDSTKANEVRLKDNFYLMLLILLLSIAISCLFIYIVFFKDKISNIATPQPIATVSPTPVPTQVSYETTGWKTYVNPKLNWSVDYPNSWYMYDKGFKGNGEDQYISVFFNNEPFPENIPEGIEIAYDGVSIYADMLDTGQLLEGILPRYISSQEPVQVDGRAATKVVQDTRNDEMLAEVYRVLETRYYIDYLKDEYKTLLITFVDRNGDINSTTFDQILSTFKFLDDGQVSTEVVVETPLPDSVVVSPLNVSGKINNSWLFEGQFTIELLDNEENEIAFAVANEVVPGSWLEHGMVDFTATLNFVTNAESGYLVFIKDNPSGLPEFDDSYEIPVLFE